MPLEALRAEISRRRADGAQRIGLIGFSAGGTLPLVLFQHFRGNLDSWDPALIDALAAGRRVITFDYAGVGGSTGTTASTMGEMAREAIAFIAALELGQVDLLRFSIGSFVAQEVTLIRPAIPHRFWVAAHDRGGGLDVADGIKVLPGEREPGVAGEPELVVQDPYSDRVTVRVLWHSRLPVARDRPAVQFGRADLPVHVRRNLPVMSRHETDQE